ncbi:uncharacterized protein G2W53_000629 [Senna tora]|uniref:Uncharacterized protein n=1 Tax=Senna tora TaxID=362788 RepID=A0A834XG36_9FABA|nr:uncharacterized protein G2W53_000629 [Senna tora]
MAEISTADLMNELVSEREFVDLYEFWQVLRVILSRSLSLRKLLMVFRHPGGGSHSRSI